MARIILKTYELSNNTVKPVSQDELKSNYPKLFSKEPGAFLKKWNELKDALIAKDTSKGVKEIEGVSYYSYKKTNDSFLVFAVGDSKKEILEKIYIQEKNNTKGDKAEVATAATAEPKEEVKKVKEVKEEKTGGDWDLSDTSISINDHVKAILNGKHNIVGKFDDMQSRRVLKILGASKQLKDALSEKKFSEVPAILIKSLKNIEPVIPYTLYDARKIAELIKEISNEVKKADFEENFKAAEAIPFDFSLIEK